MHRYPLLLFLCLAFVLVLVVEFQYQSYAEPENHALTSFNPQQTPNTLVEHSQTPPQNITLLPQYPKGVHLDPNTKYLMLTGWFGRFANNLNNIINALELARKLNRTLLHPDWSGQQFHISQIFDWEPIRDLGYQFEFNSSYYKTTFPETTYPRTKDIQDLDEFVEMYKLSEQHVLFMNSYTPFYKCLSTETRLELWRALTPSKAYKEAVDVLREEYLGIGDEEYVGVHMRRMEKECVKRANTQFDASASASVERMCSIDWEVIESSAEIYGVSGLGNETVKVFVASDGQEPEKDQLIREHGGRFVDWQLFLKQYPGMFPPALDFMLLWDADIFVGNSASSFSSAVAEIRVSKSGRDRNVLSLPPPASKGVWDCYRFRFWCMKRALNGRFAVC